MLTPELRFINPTDLSDPTPNGFSHIAIVPTHRLTAYIAGQGGEDKNGHLSTDFVDQLKQAFANLKIALAAAGTSPEYVAKINTYVVNHDELKLKQLTSEILAIWGKKSPAQTLVPVPRLALDGMLFEVEAIAIVPE